MMYRLSILLIFLSFLLKAQPSVSDHSDCTNKSLLISGAIKDLPSDKDFSLFLSESEVFEAEEEPSESSGDNVKYHVCTICPNRTVFGERSLNKLSHNYQSFYPPKRNLTILYEQFLI